MGLTEERINWLIADLHNALVAVMDATGILQAQQEIEALARASLLSGHEFVGKNAEARDREADLLMADDPAVKTLVEGRKQAECNSERAKVRLEVARAAIGLWKALAYQTAQEA